MSAIYPITYEEICKKLIENGERFYEKYSYDGKKKFGVTL